MFLCVVFKNHVESFEFRRGDPEPLALVPVKDSKLLDRDAVLARRQSDSYSPSTLETTVRVP
jgi:hypothetical protein